MEGRPLNEDALIAWLRERTADTGGRLIGDDAAILPRSERWAVTMDSQIEGVHFLNGLDPEIIARRLLAVNLSDLAAMGALPSFAFLALSAPQGFDHQRFFNALVDACETCKLELAGGDLSRQPQVAAVMTLLGAKPNGQRWLRRDTARVGESIWLGGTVGEAAAGLQLLRRGANLEGGFLNVSENMRIPDSLISPATLAIRRHLEPQPQLKLGAWLGTCPVATAIDISDSLALDLHRLCRLSDVGARIHLDRLPLPIHLERLADIAEVKWQDLALKGGEDYVLLFTLPRGIVPPEQFACTQIGSVIEDGVFVVGNDSEELLPADGWDHLSD